MKRQSKRTNFIVGILVGIFLGLMMGFALENVVVFLILSSVISVGIGALIAFDPNRTTHPEDTIFK